MFFGFIITNQQCLSISTTTKHSRKKKDPSVIFKNYELGKKGNDECYLILGRFEISRVAAGYLAKNIIKIKTLQDNSKYKEKKFSSKSFDQKQFLPPKKIISRKMQKH